jgi:hypothetical protein
MVPVAGRQWVAERSGAEQSEVCRVIQLLTYSLIAAPVILVVMAVLGH